MPTPSELTAFEAWLNRKALTGVPCGTCGKMARTSWERMEGGGVVVFYSCHGERDLRAATLEELQGSPERVGGWFLSRVFVPIVRVWRHGGASAEARRERRSRR